MAHFQSLANIIAASVITISLATLLPRSAFGEVIFDFATTDGSDAPGSGGFFDPLTANQIQVAQRWVPLETDLTTPLGPTPTDPLQRA